MTAEIRRLLGMYLVFAILLCAAAAGDPSATLPAGTDGLRRAAGPNPVAAISAVLTRLGFTLTHEAAPLAPRPLPGISGETAAPSWSAPAGEDPEASLWTATAEMEKAATAAGGRLSPPEWRLRAGRYYLEFRLTAADGEETPVLLAAKAPPIDPAAAIGRKSAPESGPPQRSPADRRPRVAIILDDVGEVTGTEDFIALPIQLTFAVMPFRRYSAEYALQAAAAGRTVLLHLPLEAEREIDPGPGAILTDWPTERVLEQLEADLESVPGAVGANNHMGSRGTSEESLMRTILAHLKERGLFFVDSRTTNRSVAVRVARELGQMHAANGKFLDPEGASVEEIQALVRELAAAAKKNGTAIGICHANRPNTLAALRGMVDYFAQAGVEVVPVSDLVHY